MALVSASDVESAIQELESDLVNSNEEICSAIAESRNAGFGISGVDAKVWRETGGVIHFKAELTFSGESYSDDPLGFGEYIAASMEGICSQSKSGELTVSGYTVTEATVHRPNQRPDDDY